MFVINGERAPLPTLSLVNDPHGTRFHNNVHVSEWGYMRATATIPPFDLTKPLDQNICSELKDSYGDSSGRFTRAFAWDEGGAAGSVRSREASTTSCKTVQENLTVTAHPILFSKFYHRQRCASYNVRLRCAIPHKVYTRVYIDDGETGSKFGDFWQTCAKGEAFPKGPTKCTSVHSV